MQLRFQILRYFLRMFYLHEFFESLALLGISQLRQVGSLVLWRQAREYFDFFAHLKQRLGHLSVHSCQLASLLLFQLPLALVKLLQVLPGVLLHLVQPLLTLVEMEAQVWREPQAQCFGQLAGEEVRCLR